jgi:hypothetical protein
LWDFPSRLPSFDMTLIGVVKGLVQIILHENTRPYSIQNDVLKVKRGSRDCQPHIKHIIDMT